MNGRSVGLDALLDAADERERPELAQLKHLRRNGACAGKGNDAFFPDRGRSALPAKEACWVCPVRAECLAFAIEHREWFGIWGGFAEEERRAMNVRHAEGVPVDEVVAMALAGDLDEEMARRRGAQPRRGEPSRSVAPYGWQRRATSSSPTSTSSG